ncbi:MAG: hypothetical protein ABSB69_16195 [Solirubrobacteraceae bacterium]
MAVLVTFGGGLALWSAAAFAFTFPEAEFTGIYIPFESFKLPAPSGVAEEPEHVSVEASSGDLFVTVPAAGKVLKLGPEGKVEGEITGAETPQKKFGLEYRGVAVDNSTGGSSKGDVYIASREHGVPEERPVVDRFQPKSGKPNEYEYVCELIGIEGGCHKEAEKEGFTSTNAFGGFGTLGVVVGASGDVYVTDFNAGTNQIYEFGPAGEDILSSPLEPAVVVPDGIAVDAAGDIYVQGASGSLEGEQVVEINAKEESSVLDRAESAGVAVNPESGEVFVLDREGEYHVTRYTSTGTEVERFGAGELGGSSGIAYSSYNHDLYVTDRSTGEVHIYTRGTPGPTPKETACEAKEPKATSVVLTCTVEPNAARAEWQFQYEQAEGATGFRKAPETKQEITGTGAVEVTISGLKPQTKYVYRLIAVNEHGATRFPETGTLPFETPPAVEGVSKCAASGVTGEAATLQASLEPLGALTEYHFQYGTSLPGSKTKVKSSELSVGVEADVEPVAELEPNRSYECRLLATRKIESKPYTTEGEIGTFTTPVVPPLAVGEQASLVGTHTATLVGRVDPKNSATSFHFEYGETATYGQHTSDEGAGSGLVEDVVGQRIEGLEVGATYHFRVVATNEQSMTTYGPDETFTTVSENAPNVQTGGATSVTQTTATISGTVDPEGYPTTYTLEIGTTTAYGTQLAGSAGSGTEPVTVSIPLQGLTAGTTYHYRLTAVNRNGTSAPGADVTFTTPAYSATTSLMLTLPPVPAFVPTPLFPAVKTTTTTTKPKVLTKAQKLAKALKACKKDKSKSKRDKCEKQARKKYGPAKKK